MSSWLVIYAGFIFLTITYEPFKGSQQTKEIFRSRLGRLPRKLKNIAELVYVDGPFELPLRKGDDVATRSWWKYGDDDEEASFEKSIQFLLDQWKEKGPFDGILGFSMGASMACAMASRSELFSGLDFIVVAGATFKDFLFAKNSKVESVDSLHIFGSKDRLVPPEVSKKVASKFCQKRVQIFEHEQGHCFPSRAEALKIVVDFLQEKQNKAIAGAPDTDSSQLEQAVNHSQYRCASDDVAQDQADEIEAMESIYPNITVLNERPAKLGDPCGHILVPLTCENELLNNQISLELSFPDSYPNVLPEISLRHALSAIDFSSAAQKLLLRSIHEELSGLEGMPCSFSAVTAAESFLSDPSNYSKVGEEVNELHISDEEDDENTQKNAVWSEFSVEEEKLMVEKATEEACLEIARRKYHADTHGVRIKDAGQPAMGKGVKKFVVGLVGKPSAGKSTFFNCITRLQVEAKVGAHPFTTIEPNFGTGWWASNDLDDEDESKTEFGRDGKGRRLLPLLIKDVAGLIPGAYKGHGKGNRFLNDLCDADILIHIVDCSGTSDKNGVQVSGDDESASSATEVGFLYIFTEGFHLRQCSNGKGHQMDTRGASSLGFWQCKCEMGFHN